MYVPVAGLDRLRRWTTFRRRFCLRIGVILQSRRTRDDTLLDRYPVLVYGIWYRRGILYMAYLRLFRADIVLGDEVTPVQVRQRYRQVKPAQLVDLQHVPVPHQLVLGKRHQAAPGFLQSLQVPFVDDQVVGYVTGVEDLRLQYCAGVYARRIFYYARSFIYLKVVQFRHKFLHEKDVLQVEHSVVIDVVIRPISFSQRIRVCPEILPQGLDKPVKTYLAVL